MKFGQIFHRVSFVFQGLLSLLLIALLLAVTGTMVWLQRDALFDDALRVSCSVNQGRIFAPAIAPLSAAQIPPSLFTPDEPCRESTTKALTEGSHLIPCFINPHSGQFSLSWPALISLLLQFALVCLWAPLWLPYIFMTLRGGRQKTFWSRSENQRRTKYYISAMLIFALCGTRLPSLVVEDLSMFLSKDWNESTCIVRHACERTSKRDASLVVYERTDNENVYRSESIDGFGYNNTPPAALRSLTSGTPITCYYDPEAPAHMRAIPYQPFQIQRYLKLLGYALLIGIGVHLLLPLLIKMSQRSKVQ